MVAFELAQLHEKAGTPVEAARWYTAAAERFRRAQWKQKAEQALTRLGAPIPAAVPAEGPADAAAPPIISEISEVEGSEVETVSESSGGEQVGAQESVFEQPQAVAPEGTPAEPRPGTRRRRRGRRGGRGRHKRAGESPATTTPPTTAAAVQTSVPRFEPVDVAPAARREPPREAARVRESVVSARRDSEAIPEYEAVGELAVQLRGRHGDPALASRTAKLESQLRRLLACPPHPIDEAEVAPAGPGVFLVTDADQTSYYYIEACQTLRVGIGHLLRGSRGSREGANFKEKLADHLGINESRVTKYVKDHCAVRWLQLDEGAPFLAHFAVAILRPVANE